MNTATNHAKQLYLRVCYYGSKPSDFYELILNVSLTKLYYTD